MSTDFSGFAQVQGNTPAVVSPGVKTDFTQFASPQSGQTTAQNDPSIPPSNFETAYKKTAYEASGIPAVKGVINDWQKTDKTPNDYGQAIMDTAGLPLKIATAPMGEMAAPIVAGVAQIPGINQALGTMSNKIDALDQQYFGGNGDLHKYLDIGGLVAQGALGRIGKPIKGIENPDLNVSNPLFEKPIEIPEVAKGIKSSETNNPIGRAQAIIDAANKNFDTIKTQVYQPALEKLKQVPSYAAFGKNLSDDMNGFLDTIENVDPKVINKYKDWIIANIDKKATTPYAAVQKKQIFDDMVGNDWKDINGAIPSKINRIQSSLNNIMKTNIEGQIQQTKPEFLPEWQNANQQYHQVRNGMEYVNDLHNADKTTGLMNSVVNLQPENIASMKVAAGKQPIKNMGYQALNDALRPEGAGSTMNPKKFTQIIKKWDSPIDENGNRMPGTGEAIFGPDEWLKIKQFKDSVNYYHVPPNLLSAGLGEFVQKLPMGGGVPAVLNKWAAANVENALNSGTINSFEPHYGQALGQVINVVPREIGALYKKQK